MTSQQSCFVGRLSKKKQTLTTNLEGRLIKTRDRGNDFSFRDEVVIAQWLARWLAIGEVVGSNPYKGENLLISD